VAGTRSTGAVPGWADPEQSLGFLDLWVKAKNFPPLRDRVGERGHHGRVLLFFCRRLPVRKKPRSFLRQRVFFWEVPEKKGCL